jgi:hypothetical protein
MKSGLEGRRWGYPLISLIMLVPLLVWFYAPAGGGLDVTDHQIGRDFINVWVGPQLAFGGKLSTLFDFRGYHAAIGELFGHELPFHNWGYPLFVLPAFWPLAQLPYFWALAVWTIGLFAVFAAVTLSQVERSERLYAFIALLLAPACLINILGGQNGFLTGALFLGGILSLERRPVLAGILFGLLTFKPQLGLVLPFALVALGAWRTIAVAALTAILLIVSSVALFGVESWQSYIKAAGWYQSMLLERFRDFYTIMMASIFAGARTFGLSYAVAMTLQAAVALPAIVAACWAVRRTDDPCRRAFVLACATALVSPYVFNYDLTIVAAALVWVLAGRLSWRPAWSPVYLLGWLAPTAMMLVSMRGFGAMPLALVALFVLSVMEAASARPAAHAASRHADSMARPAVS